ncbi:hypothetical protein HAHE_34940 [Haloferula helveola]|uniref:Uncharacterized protein n=1 Tax=Haloferula helveola TaxID=490095 RepID=A0ABN6H7H0_9BACT|nr:hypothetical protein HAHE_34940 [Haloferula helveola]
MAEASAVGSSEPGAGDDMRPAKKAPTATVATAAAVMRFLEFMEKYGLRWEMV